MRYLRGARSTLKAHFMCMKKYFSIGKVTPKIGLQLYDSFGTPVTEYACDICSHDNHPEIERIQN